MTIRTTAALLLALAPGALAAEDGHDATPVSAQVGAHGGAHWSYEGETGPEAWASLDPANAACAAGTQQSPIDLAGAIKGEVGALRRDWAPGAGWVAVNNGHTIQFNLAEGSDGGGLEIGNRRYELVQFHFHHPSEHAVDAAHSDMEVHFVHKAEDGALAVIGVMLTGGGGPGLLDALFQVAPAVEGEAPAGAADPSSLLPAEGGYYRYEGSLTTPPCTESVTWTVMTQPVAVSDQVVAAFAAVFPNDARPLQPLNRRYLLLN